MNLTLKLNNYKFPFTFKTTLSGSKNISLPIICASLLTDNKITLNNIPHIDDIYSLLNIMYKLNIHYKFKNHKLIIEKSKLNQTNLCFKEIKAFRASYYFWPILLSKNNKLMSYYPGGCNFQIRPIDEHIRLFEHFGYTINTTSNIISFIKENNIKSNSYTFNKCSVGATINALLLCFKSSLNVKLYNYSKDPEVIELIKFLNHIGCLITVNEQYIQVHGVEHLYKSYYKIPSCRIETISYLSLVLYPKIRKVIIKNVNNSYLDSYFKLLNQFNIKYEYKNNTLFAYKSSTFSYTQSYNQLLIFSKYPHFSTDCSNIIVTSLLNFPMPISFCDLIYKNRTSFLEQLHNLGITSHINCDYITITNNDIHNLVPVYAKDLRCGFALFSLLFRNEVKNISIRDFQYIKRGYTSFLKVLKHNNISYEAF